MQALADSRGKWYTLRKCSKSVCKSQARIQKIPPGVGGGDDSCVCRQGGGGPGLISVPLL